MAVIGSIRKRSTLLLIAIGGALVLFVLSDFLMSQGGGGRRPTIEPLAEVLGEKIHWQEFDFEIRRQIELQKETDPDYAPSGMDVFNLRQQRFDRKIRETILMKYCEDLGIAIDNEYSDVPSISAQEFRDMLMGSDPHPEIKRVFTNQQTGEFDPAQVRHVLENQDQLDLVQRVQWSLFIEEIKKERLFEKYQNMVAKSFYYPEPLARMTHHETRDQVTFRFIGRRYDGINDTLVTVTDEDYKKYYQAHKMEFDREAEANLYYASFEARPTPEDVAVIEERFLELFDEFKESDDPEVFIMANSHDSYDSSWFKKGELPVMVDSVLFNAEERTVYGPFVEDNKYQAAMLMEARNRPDSMRASHILIAYRGAERADENVTRSKVEAELLADSLLKEVQDNILLFDNLASTISDDAMARTKMGDLEWFTEHTMVPEFSYAVLNNDVGDIVLVESVFGYHIVHITGKKDFARQVRVAYFTREIEPSRETIAREYARASRLANATHSIRSFEDACEQEGIAGSEVTLTKDMYAVQNIQDGREIVRWALDKQTIPDKTSRMFEFPDRFQYVVAIVKSRREAGIWELDDDLKNYIHPLVIREKKHELILDKLEQIKADNLETISDRMEIPVDTATVSFNMNNLMHYGPEIKAIGTAFGMPEGVMSHPIKGVVSTIVLIVDERLVAADPDNLMDSRMIEERSFNQIIQREFDSAIKKAANVKDNRLFWY